MEKKSTPPPTPPRSEPQTPVIRGASKRKKQLGWAPPTLHIPPPQVSAPSPQYTANISMHTPSPSSYGYVPSTANSYVYPRKASQYMFSQFNGIKDFTMNTAKSGLGIGEKCSFWCYNQLSKLSKRWFTHIFLTIVIVLYTVGGALIFVTIEGRNENNLIEVDIRSKRRILLEELRNLSIQLPKEKSIGEWQGAATRRLEEFEDYIIEAYKNHKLIVANHGPKVWTFWNSVVYCSTIYTTIGYGHLYPTTTTGQGLTIVYSLIGIPLFLIILTDFGKLFTRCIKFVWSFVRRIYYTGRCRNARRMTHTEDIFKGAQMVYDIATFRRPSTLDHDANPDGVAPNPDIEGQTDTTTPTTPAPSNYEIDDEFNLPITLALSILVLYIFLGAVLFGIWEGWDFFTSFYFVFISMSTIGFGDYVPGHPVFMIVSIAYLVFGLALMSMCINVVQDKLSDTFKQASNKIGATIGFTVEDDGSIATVPPEPVELPPVHNADAVPEAKSTAGETAPATSDIKS